MQMLTLSSRQCHCVHNVQYNMIKLSVHSHTVFVPKVELGEQRVKDGKFYILEISFAYGFWHQKNT